jgi:predicted dithiol-disulfide oxidoreductase (DUF899 family)
VAGWPESGCRGCSFGADQVAHLAHLNARDTTLAYVSRAPIDKIERYKAKKGWTFPWYSSHGGDFNYDFGVTLDESVAPPAYNYRPLDLSELGWEPPVEMPGTSYFLRDGDDVFHTYSTFGRGVEVMMPAYPLLDLTALGRQEEWEEPKGRAPVAYPADPILRHPV